MSLPPSYNVDNIDNRAVRMFRKKVLRNYKNWCSYLGKRSNLRSDLSGERRDLVYVCLYLLIWGEAGNVRFTPECLCFIFKCADDYYRSPECQNRVDPVPEGIYLETVIKPLYRFMRDQGYEVVEGKFVRKEKDHDQIIGYDDINQLFWYPEGIAKIILNDNVSRVMSVHSTSPKLTASSDTSYRRASGATMAEIRSDRLEQGLLQDLLREALRRPLACQLQPYLDSTYLRVLVLHCV